MTFDLIIALTTLAVGVVLVLPRVAHFTLWRAVVTPLASIIGSGFLLLGPVLSHAFGGFAPWVMGGLCVVAYMFGGVIRSNIATGEDAIITGQHGTLAKRIETISSWALAFAYIITRRLRAQHDAV